MKTQAPKQVSFRLLATSPQTTRSSDLGRLQTLSPAPTDHFFQPLFNLSIIKQNWSSFFSFQKTTSLRKTASKTPCPCTNLPFPFSHTLCARGSFQDCVAFAKAIEEPE